MMQGLKIVTSEEMARIERGGDEEQYIVNAGHEIARVVMGYIEEQRLIKKITLLVGKGNNGADAYSAGLVLLEAGYEVQAYRLFEKGGRWNQLFEERFRQKKGRFSKTLEGLILDGLLGTGLKGKVDLNMGALIERVNRSNLSIVAIDIPSGIHGTTGKKHDVAIQAQMTIALGLPKIGCFLQDGWNHTGKLTVVHLGLSDEVLASAEAIAYLPICFSLPKMVRNRHKYQAGYVVGYAGSKEWSGAAKLSALASLKAGAGIVRLFSPEPIGDVPYEIIASLWNDRNWKEALKKAKALFVGPGLPMGKKTTQWLKTHLKKMELPCVIDATALACNISFPKNALLTPHRGEVLRLLNLKVVPDDEELFAKIMKFCTQKQITLLLKGAPTVIFGPEHKPVMVIHGHPGMATAGAGDVLTGILAALLAQGCPTREGAILGATLHGIAGEMAAQQKTGYCIVASDLIDCLPLAFQALSHFKEG